MDIKPITTDRIRLIDRTTKAEEVTHMEELARIVHLDFNLEALIRLDLRTDSDGTICVLEANPKPDLMIPSEKQTSIVCVGLAEQGMDYDDLIFGQFAHRMDFLLSHRRPAVPQICALLQ